jgi:hypothetical protein
MEYGLFVSTIRELPADPRSLCAGAWQQQLPPAPLGALYFGSEFCIDPLLDFGGGNADVVTDHPIKKEIP